MCSANLARRLNAHQNGKVKFTKTRLPFELITFISFNDRRKAFKFEKYLKSGSGKAFSQKRFV
ncbi:MAG: GIY-YIG nuclease family protein [Bacteroidetes bacterium]|nr:GIY-YIG nuclease family protein [Bacteroidota bacterium]